MKGAGRALRSGLRLRREAAASGPKLRGLPVAGTAARGGGGGSLSTASRTGRTPLSRPTISSPVSVSNSIRPLASVSRSARRSVRMRVAVSCASWTSRRTSSSIVFAVSSEMFCWRPMRIAEEHFLLVLAVHDRAELLGEAEPRHHRARDLGHLLDVAGGARGHLVLAEHQLLGDAAAHRHREHGDELLVALRNLVALGQRLHHAQRAAARDDRRLVDRRARRHA